MAQEEGLLTPQQFVFTLTARPGAVRLKPRTGIFAEASIRAVAMRVCRTKWESRFRSTGSGIILLWLKSPSPWATYYSASFIILHHYFFSNLLVIACFRKYTKNAYYEKRYQQIKANTRTGRDTALVYGAEVARYLGMTTSAVHRSANANEMPKVKNYL